jgi:hypothetical protein
MPPAAAPLSYRKWDRLDDASDEDEEPSSARRTVDPLLDSGKTGAVLDRDRATARRFESYLEKSEVPAKRRAMAAHFVAVCDRGAESSNIFRYSDIVGCCVRYGVELLSLEMVDALCELQKQMVNGVKDSRDASDPVVRDARLLMEAINSLEACRRAPNAHEFFEAVCQPSRSARAKELATVYQKLEFAKRAMMRRLFKADADFAGPMAEEERAFDALLRGATPAGSSARAPAATPPRGLAALVAGWDSEVLVLALSGAFLALCVGGGVFALYRLL